MSGGTFILSNKDFWANTTVSRATTDSSAFVKLLDQDYDIEFQLQQVLKGEAIVSLTMGFRTGGTQNPSTYFIAKIRKWDGSSETEIANAQSDTFNKGTQGTGTLHSATRAVQITVPQTTIKKGETLRLTIEFWCKEATGNIADFAIGHDPKGRIDDFDDFPATNKIINDTETTILQFQAPFRLEI